MSKSTVFFSLITAFIAGVAIASFIPFSPTVLAALVALGGAIAAFGFLGSECRQRIAVVGFVLLFAVFGIFRFMQESRVPGSPAWMQGGGKLSFRGVIIREPVRTDASQHLVIRPEASRQSILVFTRPYPEYRYSDFVRVSGTVNRPENFSEDFDYASFLAKDGIFWVSSFPSIELLGGGKGSLFLERLLSLKHAFSRAVDMSLPEPHAAFLAGLLLGERRSIPDDIVEQFRVSGTSHIVALSGYNITIVADAFLRFLTAFFLPIRIAFFAAVLGIFLFVLMTGAQASVVRAAVMGILVLVARRAGRQYRARNALVFAAALMLGSQPLLLRFDVGFQLSFLATLGLLYGAPMVEQWYVNARQRLRGILARLHGVPAARESFGMPRQISFIASTFITTVAAQLFVLPLLVYQFGTVSLASPFANLFVLPVIPATMFFGFLAGLAGVAAPVLGYVFGGAAWFFLEYELRVIAWFANIPVASVSVGRWSSAFSVIFGVLLVVFLISSSRHARH